MTQATRSSLMSVDTTLSANIDATQNYIPVASTTNFSTSVVAEIETTNEVVSFTDISENNFQQSQTFDNGYWQKLRSTVTADATTAPDGTTTAEKLTQQSGQTSVGKIQVSGGGLPVTNTKTYTISIHAKKGTTDFIAISENLIRGSSNTAWFNLNTGAVGAVSPSSGSNITRAISDLGNGWYRCSITGTADATRTGQVGYLVCQSDGSSICTSNTDDIYVWGAQFEEASTASTYLPTTSSVLVGLTDVTRGVNGTTAATASSGDAIQQLPYAAQGLLSPVSTTLSANITAAQDYVPLTSTNGFTDYLNATIDSNEVVSFASISENEVLYSQTYSNAYWTKSASTITADATTAPDGTTTASKLNETAATTQFRVMRASLVSGSAASKTFTWSCFFKKAERTAVRIEIYADTQAVESTAMFDLSNGTVGYTANVDSTAITSQGNDWYRCSLTRTMGATASALRVYHMPASGTSNGDQIYAGNTSNGIFLWGSQLEEASSPSTYLPTTTTALVGLTGVTRGVNGTTAASATSGDTVTQTPLSTGALNMPLRLTGLSVSSDGTGAGRLTLCDKVGTHLCDVDIPDTKIFDLTFDGGIIFPNGIYVANSDNITAYTLYTSGYNSPNLTAGG